MDNDPTSPAARLKRYWAVRGHDIAAWIEILEVKGARVTSLPCLRSNLINGLPPSHPLVVGARGSPNSKPTVD
jgi:hypothetical protein